MAWSEPESLSAFRSRRAYVLLGDPGAGKTTVFEAEQQALGHDLAVVVSARDLKTFDVDTRPEWHNKILFIDSLDETRAGETDSKTPLDRIRAQIARLGTPSFRLSCREADWLGSIDRRHLDAVSPDSAITVLRLDPLNGDGIRALLRKGHQLDDVEDFILKAHRNGVGAMLGNPLTLALLADVVEQGGDWPRSRREVLQRACWHLAREHNDEHRVVRCGLPRDTVVDAAGYLCAGLLLAGMEGLSLSAGHFGHGIVCLDDLDDPPDPLTRQALERAVATKLFTADRAGGAERVFTPLHRQVAEYLGGLYLARRIEGGLPARRVTALMAAPSDGRVATGLRGLSAWLAACSREARRHLIAADAVGLGLYGDIGQFDLGEQERLLEALPAALVLNEGYRDDTAWAFRSLASAELVPAISEELVRVRERTADDRAASLILGVLEHCEDPGAVAQLAPDLMEVVQVDAVPAFLRTRALDAYLRIAAECDDREAALRGLLDAIHDRSVSDPDDDLRGTLLGELYPAVAGPSEAWDYLMFRNRGDYLGRLWAFKQKSLMERSDDQNLAELLDALHARADELVPALAASRSGDLPLLLLERVLVIQGETIDPQRLLGWLATAGQASIRSTRGSVAGIRMWLEEHPEIQRAVYMASVRHPASDEGARGLPFWYRGVLRYSRPPSGLGRWCLDQAVSLADTEPDTAQELLIRSYASLADPSTAEGLTVEIMHRETLGRPVLARRLDELLKPPHSPQRHESLEEIEEQWQREEDERSRQRDAQREEWIQYLHESETDLRENRFAPSDLHTLAKSYLGMFVEDDENAAPSRRVRDFVGGDQHLSAAVLDALRGAVLRDDIPSAAETISLHSQSRHSWMAYPVLASVHLIDTENPALLDALDEDRKRELLAIYYCVPKPHPYERGWHRRWVQLTPALVLDVLCRCALSGVRAGERLPPGMNDLNAIAGCEDLAHEVRLKLLKAYPTRSSSQQLELLDSLLAKALAHPDKTELLALASGKHALKSMGVAQRVRWWTTEALIAGGSRLRQLKPDLLENEIRVGHLAQFLRAVSDRHDRRSSILSAVDDPMMIRELIEILGRWCAAPLFRSGVYTLKMHTSDLIVDLIAHLGSTVSDEARQALEHLIEDRSLAGWHDELAGAYERQRVVHRDASYRHPSVEEVQSTLDNKAPANPADLAALLGYQLENLSEVTRGDARNIWRQFWSEDPHGHPTDPKSENSCRDALLAALTGLVPSEVELEPEGSYAADWRADIRARCGDFNVPIEIKRDRHRDLWRAMRSQLIGQYTTDPATAGCGVYLVLWFGDGRVQTPPDGNRPRTPEELEQRLVQDLTEDERRKISVIVMDVSKPKRPSRSPSSSSRIGVRS